MGTMTFQLPAGLPRDAVRELERSCMAGGQDSMPLPTEQHFAGNQLTLRRALDESAYLVAPWEVARLGRLMGTSATLMERAAPYDFLLELARGKVNQVRCQAVDWKVGGLQLSPALQEHIHDATRAFGKAVTHGTDASALAQTALDQAYQAADELVRTYIEQVFVIRHQRQPRLDTLLGCRLGAAVPDANGSAALTAAFNSAGVPMAWNTIEPEEGSYRWEAADAQVEWALAQGLTVVAGPLIDFSSAQLPAWLWLWERDLPSLATFMCRFVEAAVRRYRNRVRRWQLTAASNSATVLALGEDELLQLTYRMAESARQVDQGLELILGVAQPWGEYIAGTDRSNSPFVFADTLIRSGLNLAALDVEVVMGVSPRGSYCRDLLEVSRLLDLYALLGVPLSVTLGFPSEERADLDADPELRIAAGRWLDGFSPAVQAEWASAFAALALCKPFVQGVRWTHFSDLEPHAFPHCGLLDAQSNPKPALARLRELREAHVR
jgi:hypothetical protein